MLLPIHPCRPARRLSCDHRGRGPSRTYTEKPPIPRSRAGASASSFDHLVGAGEEGRWYFQAKRPRGFEVDHEFVFGWRKHRHLGRVLALQDAVDVTGRAAVLVQQIKPMTGQAAGSDEE